MAIAWTEKMSVGNKEIDAQHQNFIQLMNRLYEAMQELKTAEELEKILNDLFAYAKNHFATEEEYFDLHNYPFSSEHKGEHRKLSTEIMVFQKRFLKNDSHALSELLDFLENWLIEHLEIQDKKYAVWFKERGIFKD